MQIEPSSYFTLFRGLENHLDATTYYVRAVIRDGQTAALLDTVNLTNNGNREFSRQWQAPADPNGNGRYITITYSVYTDSGYTTKSENYGDKYEEHEVRHRPDDVRMPSGPDIDYKRIQKMIDEAVSKIKFPENKPVSLEPVLRAIKEIEFPKIEMPEQEKFDFGPVTLAFARIETEIKELKKRPQFEKTDLSPIADEFLALAEKFTALENKLSEQIKTLPMGKEQQDAIKSDIAAIWKFLEKFAVVPKNETKEETNYIEQANKMANEES